MEYAGWFAANQSFYGNPLNAPAVTWDATNGDLVFLFRVPGVDPAQAVGGFIHLHSGRQIGYTEVFIPISGNKTKASDACSDFPIGKPVTIHLCPDGVAIAPARMLARDIGIQPVTLKLLLKLMSIYPTPHIQVSTDAYNGNPMWKDSIAVADGIVVDPTSLPKDFFE